MIRPIKNKFIIILLTLFVQVCVPTQLFASQTAAQKAALKAKQTAAQKAKIAKQKALTAAQAKAKIARQKAFASAQIKAKLAKQKALTAAQAKAKAAKQKAAKAAKAKAAQAKLSPTQKIEHLALKYTNDYRRQNKLPPLKWDNGLAMVARGHSKYMGDRSILNHDHFQKRISVLKSKPNAYSENVFFSTPTPDIAKSAVNGWINSPGHRKNLLGRYEYCGIGVYQNKAGRWYFTQIFGKWNNKK